MPPQLLIGRLLDQLVYESFQFVRSRQFTSGNFAKFCQAKHALVSFEQHRSIEAVTAFEVVVDQRQAHICALGDRLSELGKDVEYNELDSPHGHDAFLKEWDQMASAIGPFIATRIAQGAFA